MAPVYILCLLVFLISIKILSETKAFNTSEIKYFFLAFPIIFFIANPVFNKQIDAGIEIHNIPEHDLWNEINQKETVKNSSHYITDFNYIHQIYGDKPQRIIPQDFLFLNIDFLRKITDTGEAPFIILKNNELPYFYFEKLHKFLSYKKASLDNKQFTVYIKNENQN